jgi:hypothetical protein
MHRLGSFPTSLRVSSQVDSWKQLHLNKCFMKTRHKLSWKQSLGKELFTGFCDSACLSVRDEQQRTTQWNVQSRRSEFSSPELHPQQKGETNQVDVSYSPLVCVPHLARASYRATLCFLNGSVIKFLKQNQNTLEGTRKSSGVTRWDHQPSKFSAILGEGWLVAKQDIHGVAQQKQCQAGGVAAP